MSLLGVVRTTPVWRCPSKSASDTNGTNTGHQCRHFRYNYVTILRHRDNPYPFCRTLSAAISLACLLGSIVLCSSQDTSIVTNPHIYASYVTFNESVNFTHLVVDPDTGEIYVGASNWLYQFNSSLELSNSVQTGPVQDSVHCSPTKCTDVDVDIVSTNNINKVLVIDAKNGLLIACGSAHQGSCLRHKLTNITATEEGVIAVPVAANDENSSTFAYLGPASYSSNVPSTVLYVAATNSRLGPYRDMVPAICTRSLAKGNLMSVLEHSFSSIARVDISYHLKDYYLVNYVYGFSSGDFVYFAAVQRKSHLRALEEWGYITRLSRVCSSDAAYNTYTEVTLQCLGPDGTDYNLMRDAILTKAGSDLATDLRVEPGADVLVGVFTTSRGHSARAGQHSAVCVFSVNEIELKFSENIHLCYNGSVFTRNMDYIAGSVENCPEAGAGGNILDFCSETLKLNGSVPIVALTNATFPNITLSSVAATTTLQHSVVFVGTDNGYLKKLLLSSSVQADEFEEIVVGEGYPVLPKMSFDQSEQFIYVTTPYKISKVRVEICEQHTSCDLCLQARNPYCGWCSLEKRCTIRSACHNASSIPGDQSSPRWLSLDTQQCIDFQSIQPEHLPITEMAVVELVINQLPELPSGAHYLCVFGDGRPVHAEVTSKGLECKTPQLSERPPIPDDQDHVVMNLAVRSSETKTDFLHRPFAFYDCTKHRKCSTCLTSSWVCNWCLHDNLCTHNATTCSQTTNNTDLSQQHLIKGRQHCPSFSLREEILLPHGVPKEIVIDVKNLPNPSDDFQCTIEIEGAKERVSARIEDNKIICAETAYIYEKEVGEVKAILTVLWRLDTFIDKTEATLYKCNLLGSHAGRGDCSLCLTRDPKFQCAWCGGSCQFDAFCDVPKSNSCPPPRIDYIHPLTGPMEGGTLVTIRGSNLGTSEKEIQDKITIGGVPCKIIDYNVSVKVTCQTGSSQTATEAEVMVANNAGVTKAREKFSYKRVELISVHPNTGPQSGGTRLYITGNNLNIGSSLEVFLDELPCFVDKTLASSSQISCRTTAANSTTYNIFHLYLRIDNATLSINQPFMYTDDPTIQKIAPLKSFLSGGRLMTVSGTNFSSVQQPRMVVFYNNTALNESICHVQSPIMMTCPAPSISFKGLNNLLPIGNPSDAANRWKFQIGFIMDEVQTVKELQDSFPSVHSELIYVQDPRFFEFDSNKIKLYKGESLVIEGENLLLASTEHEVNVTIGTRPCNLTSLAMTQLVCLPPEVQPKGTDEIGRRIENGLPLVTIRIGSNLRFEIGYLQYEVVKTLEFPPSAIAGIAVAGSLLILITLVILAFLRQKSSQAEREYKRIQLQMDTLENSVRSECKQAFAELQTDMTDLTNDIETTGIPTLDHRTYVMKVFFPGVYDHPLLQDSKIRTNGMYSNYEIAMNHFEQLLHNKGFLLTFIDVLENQKSFNMRDKVNVASLLMIVFTERMEYATDVLKTLLLQLVEKSVCTKHPQLMLRRAESVVEKMLSNWMALCMYDYLKEHAGSSLFLLFSAIKHQVEKGPVDAVTHYAKYSLAENHLLREQIDYSIVTVQVVQDDLDEKVLCKMNDCDTITQVKSKILDALYKNTPFSLRPSVHDVDLEWRHGRGGHLTLADEDLTTKVQNGWRRLNTLKHYGVKDTAVMGLVTKQNDSFSSNCSLLHCPPGTGNTSLNSASPIVSAYEMEQGIRYWHLVKSLDDQFSKDNNHKSIPEIFLTRLLSTKGTVQKFVDDFLQTILTANEMLPPAIKWVFDLLDDAALKHNITDPEVVHAWKSNSLPLRFWVNFIKNPDFILDIQKTPIVDSCLSVVAQTLMDACSMTEHRLGKDSPSNKLLFAKDIPAYRKGVLQFYQDVTNLPPVTDQEMSATMQALSLAHSGEFDSLSALKELYVYAAKYNDELFEALEQDTYCVKMHLSTKLESVASTLEGEETSLC